jgi:hypothetical protein
MCKGLTRERIIRNVLHRQKPYILPSERDGQGRQIRQIGAEPLKSAAVRTHHPLARTRHELQAVPNRGPGKAHLRQRGVWPEGSMSRDVFQCWWNVSDKYISQHLLDECTRSERTGSGSELTRFERTAPAPTFIHDD